jgi:hypothetical protein
MDPLRREKQDSGVRQGLYLEEVAVGCISRRMRYEDEADLGENAPSGVWVRPTGGGSSVRWRLERHQLAPLRGGRTW